MASHSRGEDHTHYSTTDDEGANTHRAKRRKGPKACDVCRRKKIRCDIDPSGDTHKPCVNCAVFKTECTYTYVAKKRRTQQAFIDSLQTRLHRLEHLLRAVAPDIDIDKELDESTSTILSRPRPPSPLKPVIRPPPGKNVRPRDILSSFADWRSPAVASDESDDEQSMFIPDVQDGPVDEAVLTPHRFHGNSSGFTLLQKVIGMKRESTEGGESNKNHFMSYPDPWEKRVSLLQPVAFNFPPPSLMLHLVSVFFFCVNPFYPLLHRPSFEAGLREGRHEKDPRFGAVTMLMCAVASRWSEDPRVLPKESAEENRAGDPNNKPSWGSAGWDFYSQFHQRYRRNVFHPISVYDLQMMALGCIYLQGTSNTSAAWQMAGFGVRFALEAGVHRRRRPGSGNLLETEMWKRSFWSLVVLDRMLSSGLGRPCAIWEEDIDLDLPLETDDEYFTAEAGFRQPLHKPSQLTFFNYFVRLTQILIGALRTIYRVTKSKSIIRIVGLQWEQEMVAALDSSLNGWIDAIPEHLRWDATRSIDDVTFYQSALLHCSYNYVQIVVHRPYITPRHPYKGSTDSHDLAFPSLAICTNAARSCSHILEVCLRRGTMLAPQLNNCAFTAAIVLLFNIWGMNKPGMVVRVDWKKQMQDVHICMRFIKRTVARWKPAERLGSMLRDLVFVGDLPLPAASPPEIPQKRARDPDDPSDVVASQDTPVTSSSSMSGAEYGGVHGSRSPTFASSGTYEPANINSLAHGHNPEHSGGALGGVKPDPLFFEQLHLQPDTNPYPKSGGTSFNVTDQQGPSQGQQPQSQGQPQGPPGPQQLQQPVGEFQYDAEEVLRSLSYDQQGIYSQGPQSSSEAHAQMPRADDVLTALDAVYLGGSEAGLIDMEPLGDGQQTYDVWGNVPGGFQWDQWQQFTDVTQNPPAQAGTGTTETTEATEATGFGEQPLMWTNYRI